MSFTIRRVAIVGAGTMGAQIAAHCANVGLQCDLLDIAPEQLTEREAAAGLTLEHPRVANRPVTEAFDRMRALRPSPFTLPALADRIRLGNTRDHLERLQEADWIVEAVVERLPIKRAVLQRIEAHRRPGTLVSSNTSGLSITAMAEGRSDEFRTHFLGTHFFNPPRYLHLLELIPTAATRPVVLAFFREFGSRVLGKGIVVCRDTPYFIANRVGCFAHSSQIHGMRQGGYTVDEVDVITAEPLLRPRSATFRLADIVGLDLLVDVGRNLVEALPNDPARDLFLAPDYIEEMVRRGWTGEKGGQGFYQRVRGASRSE
ncbi:MAG: 3-hydroxyacyl-CoA dehydrogenase family protein, partial [SAR202 cluster bacterium]|nr:3-hydroxyacyl-CoA dehydrogenase family protein [SAR202 cluster bacterium]